MGQRLGDMMSLYVVLVLDDAEGMIVSENPGFPTENCLTIMMLPDSVSLPLPGLVTNSQSYCLLALLSFDSGQF